MPVSNQDSFHTQHRSNEPSDHPLVPQATLTETDSQIHVQYEFEKLEQKFGDSQHGESLHAADKGSENGAKAIELHERKVVLDKRVAPPPPRVAQESDITKQSDTEGMLSSDPSNLVSRADMNEYLETK